MNGECDPHCTNFCRLLTPPRKVQAIAIGPNLRVRQYLNDAFGGGRWRKLKGQARIETFTAEQRLAEIHWYEAAGIGKRLIKYKFFLD